MIHKGELCTEKGSQALEYLLGFFVLVLFYFLILINFL